MEITLLRHGKPIIPSLAKLSAGSFHQWVKLYDSAGLSASSKPTNQVVIHAANCSAVVCSELPRSIESAKALNIKDITLSSSLFNEAGLPIANWQHLKLSPKIWAVFFRVLWLLGYSNNSESYNEAKARSLESATKLTELAEEHKNVLFVGHGVYNRLVSKQLIAAGWSVSKKPSSKHWGFSVYKKT